MLYRSFQPHKEQKAQVQAVLPLGGTQTKLHTPWPREENPALLTAKKYPHPVHLEGGPLSLQVSREYLKQLGWFPDQPWSEPQTHRAGQVHNVWSSVSRVQVLNTRNPPNAVPDGLLFITDPWVNSNHTLSSFCSSAIAKAVAVLPPLCSSVVLTGVRW